MQELRLVAVSEDGTYAILAVPGRSGRFLLPIDDRLRTVAKGQFSRLAQYEIEVENPLRPKEIQDRIRAGETADEIADAAGIPPDRIRRFEGPILAERQYQADQAQRATIRGHSESGPGPRLGDIVTERLSRVGASADSAEWDSRKRPDGNWQVILQFSIGGRPGYAEWIFDSRRRHVIPDDDQAVRLCLPQEEWAAVTFPERSTATATVTPIGSRQGGHVADYGREHERRMAGQTPGARSRDAARTVAAEREAADFIVPAPAAAGIRSAAGAAAGGPASMAAGAAATGNGTGGPALGGPALGGSPLGGAAAVTGGTDSAAADGSQAAEGAAAPAKKAAGGKRRASVPSWDEIMFGTSRQQD
jgi:hypothetical protein